VKPVTAVQHLLGSASSLSQASSPNKTPAAATSAVNRQKRPPPLHINSNHTSAVVGAWENYWHLTRDYSSYFCFTWFLWSWKVMENGESHGKVMEF